jgi:CBS domain-containing protein
MESLGDSMRAAMGISSPPPAPLPTAKDIMVSKGLITFRPQQRISEAIKMMVQREISGAPVVDEQMNLLGVLSEFDCLRVIAAGAYDGEPVDGNRTVEELMSTNVTTIGPSLNLYGIAHTFITRGVRRLPVVEGRKVLGQLSRLDVLKAVQSLI